LASSSLQSLVDAVYDDLVHATVI